MKQGKYTHEIVVSFRHVAGLLGSHFETHPLEVSEIRA